MRRLIQMVIAGIVTVILFLGLTLCVLLWKDHTTLRPDREAEMASRLLG